MFNVAPNCINAKLLQPELMLDCGGQILACPPHAHPSCKYGEKSVLVCCKLLVVSFQVHDHWQVDTSKLYSHIRATLSRVCAVISVAKSPKQLMQVRQLAFRTIHYHS